MQSITRYQREQFIEVVKAGVFVVPNDLTRPELLLSVKYVVTGLYGIFCYPLVFTVKLLMSWVKTIYTVAKIRKHKTSGRFDYFKMRRVGKELYDKEHAQEIAERKEHYNRMWTDIFNKINKAT